MAKHMLIRKQKIEKEISQLADAFSVSPETIHAAIDEWEEDCTIAQRARKELHRKLDYILNSLYVRIQNTIAFEREK